MREHVAWGPGPRAAQALMLASRARAVLDGRLAPSVDDVAALAHPVLRHRMALKFSARADGVTLAEHDRPAGGAPRVTGSAASLRGAVRRRRWAPPAAAAGRRRAGRDHRRARRARPPPRRAGRQFLAVPPVPRRATRSSRIDWRVSARSDRAYVRETEWEAAQTVCLWRRRRRLDALAVARAAGREGRPRRAAAAGAGGPAAARRRAGAADRATARCTGRAGLDRLADALDAARTTLPGGLPRWRCRRHATPRAS